MAYKMITQCRVCFFPKLEELFSLGGLHLNAFVARPEDATEKVPMTLVHCKNCDLVQLRETADFSTLYQNHYWYRSGLNPVIVADLKEIAHSALKIASLDSGDTFVDIGANDGTLLSFVPKHHYRIGVEPAHNLAPELQRHCNAVKNTFWENVQELPNGKAARVITAISMLYDLDDPNRFMQNIKRHLAPDGLFVTQLMTLRPMVENNDVSNICHEHLEYYSYPALRHLFERNGLEIFRVEENAMNGGSYRLFVRHYKKGSVDFQEDLTPERLHAFVRASEKNKADTVAFIRAVADQGKKVYGYGASTKGNTILQWYGLGPDLITAIADKNPQKWGRYSVGTNIPIVSEEDARAHAEYFFVMPWGFLESFMEREAAWRAQGGKFIASIPTFQVL